MIPRGFKKLLEKYGNRYGIGIIVNQSITENIIS